ncbi:MAG: carboxypeptidase-like regulatory domain-containing protein [Pyrinomonadaceae bacterium MAG19_C2-C3]|nr:carboxypeptidase-like regulatory domain-containing protein [Pyrinomonadaceae bacterium MAG19_C2-C3]
MAQDTVTGAFEGNVTNSLTGDPVVGATAEIINGQTGQRITKQTDARGRFYQGRLAPAIYTIRVSARGFQTAEVIQELLVTRTGEVVPVPVTLDPLPAAGAAPSPTPVVTATVADTGLRAQINTGDARRDGSFTEDEALSVPLGTTTLVRTFDELALLLPGVTPPPQTIGNNSGPGQGAGVGSAGQFAVNGLRSRANNFTVDGSDNNDEDIGVRRQGFVSLIAQPLESIREYQVITLLAPAQFGRNLGAQVNAVSKSGGSETHGALYGTFNSSQLNARNFFDTTGSNQATPLRTAGGQAVLLDGAPFVTRYASGAEDSFTFFQSGFVLGGRLTPERTFYFVSAEVQKINATQEESFAVPTLEQRGAFSTGASGTFRNPFTGAAVAAIPVSRAGSAVFNLFPYPNNPPGIYGGNTFTQTLPADGRGIVLSGRFDGDFRIKSKVQTLAARYNFTDDFRIIPATGGALFSSLKPKVKTQNFSFFFNNELAASGTSLFNQLRLSYGRTRLRFEEIRDTDFLLPSQLFPDTPFLLNAPLRFNATQPAAPGASNTGDVLLRSRILFNNTVTSTVERELGAIGQINVAGFSPVGVDVFNFPQRRVNNTYQAADELAARLADHTLVFGADVRRTELNSDLPRNARPLITFNGAPRLIFENGALRLPTAADGVQVVRPEDLVAFGAASNSFLTLSTSGNDAGINLRFYQFNFYAQDAWRVRRNFSLSYGLRYEYNTPVREVNRRIENTFADPLLALAPGLRQFIENRTSIYEPDRNNFAPRLSFAYAPQLFGRNRVSVVRAGYGVFYDQILGAVVSQSRNVYPRFLTLNFGGIAASANPSALTLSNPSRQNFNLADGRRVPLLVPGTISQYNPDLPLDVFFRFNQVFFPSALGATLPARTLATPSARHYSFAFEQQVTSGFVASIAYVGTQGRNLLRFTTPNLGASSTVTPTFFQNFQADFAPELRVPQFIGFVSSPSRPVAGIGAVNRFETTARSRYDSLQLQARGRLRSRLRYQAGYVFSKATDDVSDVFDLAGAFVLPQNSRTLDGERGRANFDVPHRLTFNFAYDLPALRTNGKLPGFLFDNVQVAGAGRLQSGQPFTLNSVFDVNLDGNLTDRPDTTDGIVRTGSRAQPLGLTARDTLVLLAPFGQDGRIGRNTFRSGSVVDLDVSLTKTVTFSGAQQMIARVDVFNFINQVNFGIPVRIIESPGFGRATNTITPARRIQFAVKFSF